MITQMNHVSFTVADLDRSVAFYKQAMGLELSDIGVREGDFGARVTGLAGAKLKIAYVHGRDCAVELIQYLAPAGQKIDTRTCNVGSAHVAFNVDEFDAFLARALAAGAKQAGEAAEVPAGPNKGKMVVYIEDPDGNTIELLSNQVKAEG